MTDLFTPIRVGPYQLPNRIFMAPLTRCRTGERRVPDEMTATYYAQRASSGLLISEATQIAPEGIGYPGTPGVHSPEQVAGWTKVTAAVHAKGGRIFCQLWHVGRASHTAYQPSGRLPVSSSALAIPGEVDTPTGKAPYPVPRALELTEIPRVMEQYRHAAKCALEAGFDGVELHGANGYLPDQFLRDGVNRREDAYGGAVANRARFMMEAAQALIDVWGASRVGVRLSPGGAFNGMSDSDTKATFSHVVKELGRLGLAYLHITEAQEADLRHGGEAIPVSFFRPLFDGVLVTNAGFTFEKAQQYLAAGWADAVAFGKLYIANPDLVERFRAGAPLNTPNPETFYGGGEAGYVDYPALVGV